MAVTNKFPAGLDLTPAYYNEHVGMPVTQLTTDIESLATQIAPNPFVGQMLLGMTDAFGTNAIHQYRRDSPNGSGAAASGWQMIIPTDGSTTSGRRDVRYEHKVAQSIPNATETAIGFDSVSYDSDNLFRPAANNAFSPFYPGVYLITASLRLLGNAGGGQRGLTIQLGSNSTSLDFTHHIAQSWQSNVGSAPVTLSCSAVVRLRYVDWIIVGAYQNCGAAINTDVGFGGTNHVSLTWLRPLTES